MEPFQGMRIAECAVLFNASKLTEGIQDILGAET